MHFIWAKKVPQDQIAQLYCADAEGNQLEKLVDEVGWGFYARCKSILAVTEGFEKKRLLCPVCERLIPLTEHVFSCPCGVMITWEEFRASYKNKQLYGANALPVFEKFIAKFPQCVTYSEKMIVIDTLIHSFHILHSYRHNTFTEDPKESDRLGRPAAANLISGSLQEVIAFCNTLSETSQSIRWRELMKLKKGDFV